MISVQSQSKFQQDFFLSFFLFFRIDKLILKFLRQLKRLTKAKIKCLLIYIKWLKRMSLIKNSSEQRYKGGERANELGNSGEREFQAEGTAG